jgi:hypothetical protein
MKKGSYWFGSLSEKEQAEFKQNFLIRIESRPEFQFFENPFETFCLDREFSSLRKYILFAFMWATTEQGFQYWCEISYRKTDEVNK